MRLTRFESDLIRLHWVANRCMIMYNEFYAMAKVTKGSWMMGIIREYMIIQLVNFIKIRKSLINTSEKVHIFDKCLEPYWSPIFKQEKGIRELRNSYFAHMQDDKPFQKFIQTIIIDDRFPTTFGDILFFGGCVYKYYEYLRLYFKANFDSAIIKYKKLRPKIEPKKSIFWQEVPQYLVNAKQIVEENLKKSNLKIL